MPSKALKPSGTFTLVRPFDDLALFSRFVAGTTLHAGLLSGEMEISIDPDINGGEWWISDIHLMVENFKPGSFNKSAMVTPDGDSDERFMLLLLDAIADQYGTWIEDLVQDELAEARYCRRDAA